MVWAVARGYLPVHFESIRTLRTTCLSSISFQPATRSSSIAKDSRWTSTTLYPRASSSPSYFPPKRGIFNSKIQTRSLSQSTEYGLTELPGELAEDGNYSATRFVVPRSEGVGNVRAYYIAKKINVVPMFQKMYGRQKNWLEVDSLIISFQNEANGSGVGQSRGVRPPPPPPDDEQESSENAEVSASGTNNQFPPYAVFFDYGAVVFFNCDEVLQTESIAQAQRFCEGYLIGGTSGSDDFTVEVDGALDSWSVFKANRLVLQKLDINNIRVISSVLGQSVALGHFEQVVDGMLQSFDKANSEASVASHGYNPAQTKLMFRILRESNTVLSEVIVKLGVLDRTRMRDTAWKYEKYFTIWDGLREEFEIDARWDIMNTKTDYLQHNMRFFVELLHSQKSERLEWMIIFLITLELLVSLYGLYIGFPH